jgi:alkanesulfonate monooxygenase
MKDARNEQTFDVFATCPQSSQLSREDYLQQVIAVARWSEAAGCRGILVYTDNSLVDSWLVAQVILQNSCTICPLIAVQPIYMHPYAVAKMTTSFAHLYGRKVYLNMVAGGFKNDLLALNDTTDHNERYDRLTEYTTIIKQLLASPDPVTFEGKFYQVRNLRMTPPMISGLEPGIFLSGSSEAGQSAAEALGATAIQYPKPPKDYESVPPQLAVPAGIRVGLIARPDGATAWKVAYERFPEDRKGQITHQLAMKVSDSEWHKQLSELAKETEDQHNPYWLRPFENYKTFCPYLVGNYKDVAAEVSRYIDVGYRTFILDIPPCEEELTHTGEVFRLAERQVSL